MNAKASPLFDSTALYDHYRVKIQIRERIYGGVPRDKEVIAAWVKARTGFDDEQTKLQIAEAEALTEAAVGELIEETAEKMWTGFPVEPGKGLFIFTRQVKAMLRESMTMLGITKKKIGSKQILQHGIEVKGFEHDSRLYLGVSEASGTEEGPIHVMTAKGPRTALKRQDYVETPTLSFQLWVLTTAAAEKRHIGQDEVVQMLTFAQENGLGASRSQGHGKFNVIEFEQTKKGKRVVSDDTKTK